MSELREELQAELDATPSSEQLTLNIPMHVLLGEGIDLAAFVQRTWAPTDAHPGLTSAA